MKMDKRMHENIATCGYQGHGSFRRDMPKVFPYQEVPPSMTTVLENKYSLLCRAGRDLLCKREDVWEGKELRTEVAVVKLMVN